MYKCLYVNLYIFCAHLCLHNSFEKICYNILCLKARGAGLADFIQPSLGPLQPNLEDYVDTLQPLQGINL